jgi:hypothetical protein
MWSPEPYDLMDPCPECRIVEFSSSIIDVLFSAKKGGHHMNHDRLVEMAMEREMNRNLGKAM